MALGTIEITVIFGFLTVFSIGLLTISLISYMKSKNQKILFVTGVFLIFSIKGVLLSLSIFITLPLIIISVPFLGIFDFIILSLLFIATLKK